MRILIIDNNIMPDSFGCENLRAFARKVPGATITVRRAPSRDLPTSPAGFDRVVVSGSMTSANESAPWVDRLLDFIRSSVNAGKPYLGVCYGHQMLARALGGERFVRPTSTPEFGWSKIEVTGESPLLHGLPREFHSFSSHSDEVASLPSGTRAFARSERCAIQAFGVINKPAFGIQFHPEKELPECDESVSRWKKERPQRPLLEPTRGKAFYRAEIGETVFRNFFEL